VVSKSGRICGLAVVLVLNLSGCATAPSVSSFNTGTLLPADVELTEVAFYPQTQDQCGPAALATVLHHAGVARNLEQLRADVYVPQRQGSLPLEMLGGARRAGVVPYVLKGEPQALWQEVAAGHPVVVLQSWDRAKQWAFVALPPDQLPATASAAEFVQAAITLERVAPEQAAQAYRTALQRWPQNLEARLA